VHHSVCGLVVICSMRSCFGAAASVINENLEYIFSGSELECFNILLRYIFVVNKLI
jgi:hypothetical protein